MPCFDEWTLNWHGESNIDSVLENAPPEGCRAVRGPSSKLLSDRVDKVDGPVNLGSGWLAVAEHLTLTGD